MAPRQRFIHPEIWKDPVFGRLQPLEQVLFIGLFSIADDEGRTMADPAYLRSELFAYSDFSLKKVQALRDSVVQKVRSVHLYEADGGELIALLKWSDYQKPKYPKPSKIPPPMGKPSPNLGESLPQPFPATEQTVGNASPETAHGLGLGREDIGLGRACIDERAGGGSTEQPQAFRIPELREIA